MIRCYCSSLDDLVFWILILFMSQDNTHYQNHRNDPHELHVFRASMQYLKYRCALLYFWFISVGVIDGINISNIWCYLCPIIACVKYRVVKFSNSFFEIICHKLLPFLKMPFEQYIREGSGYEIGWIFRKVPKRGWGGHFQSTNLFRRYLTFI